LTLGGTDTTVPQLITSVYWGMRDIYRIDYTSSSPAKDWRNVCMSIKDRPDLYVLRESGNGYRAEKSAYAHLLRMIEDRTLPMPSRREALVTAARIGTEFDLPRIASYGDGEEKDLHVPALVSALALATRLGQSTDRVEKLYAKMDPSERLASVTELEACDDCDESAVERVLLGELRRPADRTTEDLRWESLVALGRLERGLSNETLRLLGTLTNSAGTPPAIREGARRLLESTTPRTAG